MAAAVASLSSGCGPSLPPVAPLPLPERAERREELADALGRELFEALRGPGAESLLADGSELDAVYVSAARGRLLAEQASTRRRVPGAPWAEVWRGHKYGGVCAQGDHVVPLGALGLRRPTWVLDRVLVVARRGSWSSAAWVTGTFVLTTGGLQTIAISEVEEPRPNHADLELAPCDVQRGL